MAKEIKINKKKLATTRLPKVANPKSLEKTKGNQMPKVSEKKKEISTISFSGVLKKHPNPIIISGMHRSGTSLLVQLLETAGVFMGKEQSKNKEALLFQDLNMRMLDAFGCSWRTLDFLPNPKILELFLTPNSWMVTDTLRRMGPKFISYYWGKSNIDMLLKSNSGQLNWGWKDPRNSLLLPLWCNIFPDARVIHIYRDGRDVALSLLKREISRDVNSNKKLTSFFNKQELTKRFYSSLDLWAAYNTRATFFLKKWKNSYIIKFEDLLVKPRLEIKKLLKFANISPKTNLFTIESKVDSTRTRRFESDNSFAWVKQLKIENELMQHYKYL